MQLYLIHIPTIEGMCHVMVEEKAFLMNSLDPVKRTAFLPSLGRYLCSTRGPLGWRWGLEAGPGGGVGVVLWVD